MADILKGAPVAEAIAEGLTARAAKLRAQGIEPCLAVLRVGAQDGDLSYEHAIFGHYDQVGIRVMPVLLPAECTQAALTAEIEKINADPRIHGCIMFRPLPRQLDEQAAAGTLIPCKDVDCMTPA
ncbi:MAG: bifunctional 5,10-methylene-tetrahydrofolate dehydrogenase/5,10-methylene-tetrahydrofolate cyclohydrolase, partial [Oscillospiraceae bacterium]|nr:bifunctional 5,10-methylene-tetrahydrofolate dehydrogenase/5,10-methylene-tetrahydrofolate cyclohydrolase [Oscillospiraceae bacterium]